MNKMVQYLFVFLIGFTLYPIIEIVWRGHTHWTMACAGGGCFFTLYLIYAKLIKAPFWKKCLIGGGVITSVEFIFGCMFNLILKWNIWDYSSLPGNVLGQVCLQYIVLWTILSIPIIYLCNFMYTKFSKMKM